MTAFVRDEELAGELQALGEALEWPATPGIAAAVRERLVGEATPRGASSLFTWRPARRAVLLAILAVLLAIGVAAGIGFALGGLQIQFGGPPPGTPLPPEIVAERGFGARTDLDTASAQLGSLLVPDAAALGAPDHVYYDNRTRAVALAWGARPGLPADPRTGLSVVVTEFRADITPGTFTKVLHEGALLERTSVGGNPAYWIAGGEHFFFFQGPNGEPLDATIRMVGTTLLWEQDGLTVRVEGAATMASAVRIAESMEARGAP